MPTQTATRSTPKTAATQFELGMDVIRACHKVGPFGLTLDNLTRRMADKFGLPAEVTHACVEACERFGKVRKVQDHDQVRYIATGL